MGRRSAKVASDPHGISRVCTGFDGKPRETTGRHTGRHGKTREDTDSHGKTMKTTMTAEAISGTHWKIVELRSIEFHRSLAVAILSKGGVKSEDLFLELAPFHDHFYTIDCYQWLDIHSTHRIRGCKRALQLGTHWYLGDSGR